MSTRVFLVYTSDYDAFTVHGICVSLEAADAFIERRCVLERERLIEQQCLDRAFVKVYGRKSGIKADTDLQAAAKVKRYRNEFAVEEWPLLTVKSTKTWRA